MPGKKAISLRGLTQGLALTLRIILEEEGIEKIIVLHVLVHLQVVVNLIKVIEN